MIMTSLQNFINRRATSRNVAVRSESPVKTNASTFNSNNAGSHIPLASTRVPSRNTTHSRGAPAADLRDDSDDFKDSEILSLENQDDEEYDEEDSEHGEFLQDFNREEVGGRYLVNNHQNGASSNGGSLRNGSTNGGDVYRWQKNVVPISNNDEEESSDEESDGRVTPKIRIADEPAIQIPTISERTHTPPGRRDGELASEQLQQEQFYSSLDFETPAEEVPLPSTSDGVEDRRVEVNGSKGGQSWEEIDRDYSQNSKTPAPPVRFDVGGLLEVLKEMGVPVRGSERIILQDTLPDYKLFSIHNPTLPYQILIPYNPLHPSEPTKMLSEIATMSFVRRTCPSLPIPEIAYHNLDPSNPSKVPFMVIRTLKGRTITSLEGGIPAALKDRKRSAALMDGLARVQCQIMRSTTSPNSLHIDRIGNICFKADAKKPKQTFIVGPFLGADDESNIQEPESSPPMTELADLCLQVFQSAETNSLALASRGNNGSFREVRTVKRRLAGLLGLLPSVPEAYSQLTLFHNSLGLSNVLVDPATGAITCVLGWRDVYTIPFALTPVYPPELYPTNSEWRLWSGDDVGRNGGVDKYWGLRSIYETRMAKYDARFAGDVWDDEEVGGWLRVWEVVNDGVEGWVRRRRWIEAELERLRRL